jgi:ubiquinone/menaquinone biosynthesis C-methylase UbiE
MQRTVIPELLDEDLGTPAEIAASLGDLQRINEWFGGTRTTTTLLRRIARSSDCHSLSMLEVGAGNGHVPIAARQRLAAEGITVRVTLLDRVASHLPKNGTPVVVAEALELPFRENVFDVVACNLLAHHFEPDELRAVAAEALRVARIAVLINDVIRSRFHLALTYAGLPLFRSRITRHDAPASVRRAYTLGEMREIVNRAGARRIECSTHCLYRMGFVLWK